MSGESVNRRQGYSKIVPDLNEEGGREIPERDPDANVNP